MTYTNKLREIRLKKNLSQEYIALELGISQKAYSDLENGKTSLSFKKMETIANILQTPVGDLCPSTTCNCKADSKQLQQLKKYLADQSISIPKKFK